MYIYLLFLVIFANKRVSALNNFVNTGDELDRFMIACHTTDFECFKRQYITLRDRVLMGNKYLHIPVYQHYVFQYEPSVCVKISGLEESELRAIGMFRNPKKLTLTLSFPLRIQQIKNIGCSMLGHSLIQSKPVEKIAGTMMMRFRGNASILISYPYELRNKRDGLYLKLSGEVLEVVIDIPDLNHFDRTDRVESTLREWSEWAYDVIKHIDAAHSFVQPYTNRLKEVFNYLPLNRFLMLYPEQDYKSLQFYHNDTSRNTN